MHPPSPDTAGTADPVPAPSPPAPAPAPRDPAVAAAVIVLATLLAYSNSFGASFHFDDVASIVDNPQIRDLGRLWPPSGTRWLGYLSFAVNYRLGGLGVGGYHLANVLFHACNALLVAWLAALTLRTPAVQARASGAVRRWLPLAAGLLFAVHPLATQAVTYVVQRLTSLATLFYLLSVAAYGAARLGPDEGRPRRRALALYAVSLASAAAAMKTKEIAFTLPVAAAGYDLLFLRRGRARLLLVPLAAIALLVPLSLAPPPGLKTVLDANHLPAETDQISRWSYLLTQTRVLVTYLRLLVLPVRQNLDYDFRVSTSLADPAVWGALAILLAVAAGAVLLLVRSRRAGGATGALVFLGVAWFFLTISVESSIVPIRDVIFEHRTYLPLAGAAVAIAAALLRAAERVRVPVALALVAVALPLAGATWARNRAWKDDVTLWSDTAAKSPRKARPHFNLGHALLQERRFDDAIREYREAVRLKPEGLAVFQNDLGLAYIAADRFEDAIQVYEEALRTSPGVRDLHDNLGFAYAKVGRTADAIREYQEALRIDPEYALAHRHLGAAYGEQGRTQDAMREYREAIRIDPDAALAHRNLGAALGSEGQLDEAIREYREAVRLAPGDADLHHQLGLALRVAGRTDEAIREYREAARLGPRRADVRYDLGIALASSRAFEDAARELAEAVRLDPSDERARAAYAKVLSILGRGAAP